MRPAPSAFMCRFLVLSANHVYLQGGYFSAVLDPNIRGVSRVEQDW